jgi:hypothetical protein
VSDLFNTGIRPAIDDYLAKKSQEQRDYGDYWSASSAGYCMRKLMFERLGLPPVQKESDARKQRVFEAGHVFHEWAQRITKEAGLSIAQELELQDEDIMVRGHIDDLVLVDGRLMLYDYKTQHANAFTWQKGRPPSHFHRLQAGTYMYMLRKRNTLKHKLYDGVENLSEARILKISKDDLRMDENQILWDAQLKSDVLNYWNTLNGYWREKKLPKCSCADFEGGFMAKENYNPYFYNGQPCSLDLYKQWKLAGAAA